MATLVAAFFYLHGGAPIAHGEVVSLEAVPISASAEVTRSVEGMAGSREAFHEIFVVARVSVDNLSDKPQTLHLTTASLMPHNQFAIRAVALDAEQLSRAYTVYPQLQAYKMAATQADPTLAPHQSTVVQWVFVFPITASEWQQRDGFGLEISYVQPIHNLYLLLKGKETSGSVPQ